MIIRAIFLSLFIGLFPMKNFITKSTDIISQKEKTADAITHKTAKILSKKYNLVPSGTGASMMDDIKMLSLSFHCCRILSIDEARKLIVPCVQEYLHQINTNPEIKPYLHNYPFTPNNVQIRIFCLTPNRKRVAIGQMCVVANVNGKIDYDILKTEYQHETIKTETFEEAVQLLEQQKSP